MSSSEAVWLLTVTGANTAHAQTHSESLHQPPLQCYCGSWYHLEYDLALMDRPHWLDLGLTHS